jgi:hypothetical protein
MTLKARMNYELTKAHSNKVQTLGSKAAAALDKDLMSSGGFSIDQLMELAGLSVSQAGTSPDQSISSGTHLISPQYTDSTHPAPAAAF